MNLDKYIDQALVHYKSAYSKLDAWERERQAATAEFQKEAQRLTREAAVEENARLVREFREKREAIVNELKEAVAAVEAEYMQEVKAFYAPNGAAISAEDQALLASGILSVEEVSEMILKHAENPTMERIIKKYVNENHIENLPVEAAKALYRATYGGESEQRIFNNFKQLVYTPVSMANEGLAGTETFMACALKADEYAKDIKIDLLKAKLALNDQEKETLRQVEHEQMVAKNGGYDPFEEV